MGQMVASGSMGETYRRLAAMAVPVVFAVGCVANTAPPPPASSPTPVRKSPLPVPSTPPPLRGAGVTGVPLGTALDPYSGPCEITVDRTVIDAKHITCALQVRAEGVVISRSRVDGNVAVRDLENGNSLVISDTLIRIGETLDTGLGNGNFVASRVEIVGGRRSIHCESNCTIEDSRVYGQAEDPTGEAHLSGIRMGSNVTIRRNTIVCEVKGVSASESGCSAGLTGYGDFAPVRNNLIERNIFQAGTSAYCAYGGSSKGKKYSDDARNIRFVGNEFHRGKSGKCGIFGAIASFDPRAPGNEWRDNVWSDGSPFVV